MVSTNNRDNKVFDAREGHKSKIEDMYNSVDPKVKILFDYDFSNIADVKVSCE